MVFWRNNTQNPKRGKKRREQHANNRERERERDGVVFV
jgi:hypothetical protein